MATPLVRKTAPQNREAMTALTRGGLALIWDAVRLPVLATLLILEPPFRFVLSGIALLGFAIAIFFEYIVRLPNFPFGLVLGLSAGCAALLVPFHLLIRLVSVRP